MFCPTLGWVTREFEATCKFVGLTLVWDKTEVMGINVKAARISAEDAKWDGAYAKEIATHLVRADRDIGKNLVAERWTPCTANRRLGWLKLEDGSTNRFITLGTQKHACGRK